ncbi:amidase [Pelagibaculum spongiae]|uniref:Amidase n=1 Tax=Pelagibaculum spongiae TaxID=2080658 RepID=A0A2V1H262_9GAMM|nr:amidase [Pelagibaculum spongiae]PVZ70471.1 amidase [Pelagibaculum spongiae]
MTGFAEYTEYDAIGLAQLIAKKQITAAELLNEARARAAQVNPKINAIIRDLPEFASQSLNALPQTNQSSVFSGVPFLLKDLLAQLKGTPITNGSNALKNFQSSHSSDLVKRWQQAGLIIFGKTNTPEMGLMGITEPKAFGACRNPWDLSLTPGGSSGGSAAAVASGILPMASGGDGGGSIRIPASCCGLFGFKPGRGLIPTGPDFRQIWEGAAVEHVLTRSVRDSAAMLDISAASCAGDGWPTAIRPDSWRAAMGTPPKQLKIGFSVTSPIGSPVAKDCIDAVEHTAKLLQALGHHVELVEPDINGDLIRNGYLTMYMGQMAAEVRRLSQQFNLPASQLDLEPTTRALARLGETVTAGEYVTAINGWNLLGRKMGQFHQEYDLLLTPTLGDAPQPVGSLYPSKAEELSMKLLAIPGIPRLAIKAGLLEQMSYDALSKAPFTQLSNLTGAPAMSVPLYWNQNNTPIGVQLMAAVNNEGLLFSVAHQLEQAQPWFDQVSPLFQSHQCAQVQQSVAS